MHIVDVIVVLLWIGIVYAGVRNGLLRQLGVSVGLTIGLFAVAFVYSKVASLGSGSSVRIIILVLLTMAVLLLCYSLSMAMGGWLRARFQPKNKHFKLPDMIAGGALAFCAGGILLWILVAMFGAATPMVVRAQLAQSATLTAIRHVAAAPPLFRNIAHLLQPFQSPAAFVGNEPVFNGAETAVDQQFMALDAVVAAAHPSVLKINAWGCGSTSEGTGFLVGKRLIMTNAHVIAGAGRISVQDSSSTYTATPVWFDPETDDAVLMLAVDPIGAPLTLEKQALTPGTLTTSLGYPNDGSLLSRDGTVLQLLSATGYDIYGKTKIVRRLYAIRSEVTPGSSGSPLLIANGKVAGMVFGNSVAQEKTGYAIAASELDRAVATASRSTTTVSTGACTGE